MTLELNSLVNNLASHVKACEHLLKITQEEQDAVINNRASELNSIVEKKHNVLKILDHLNKAKAKILQQFSNELQLSFRPVGVEQIVEYLPPSHKDTIKKLILVIKQQTNKLPSIL